MLGTSTADGSGVGTVTFSTKITTLFVLNLTDTDDIWFRECSDLYFSDWKKIPMGLRWRSLRVPDDTIEVQVKHTTTAQDVEITGDRLINWGGLK